jgi:hypothetical protein
MKRIIYTGAALAALITAGGVTAAAPAMAGTPHKIVAATFSPTHLDTTSVSGTATTSSPNGPVWAYDNLHETFTVTPVSGLADGANYSVTIRVHGTFDGFADPRPATEGSPDPGGQLYSFGQMQGTIQYDIKSATAPNPAALPRVEPPATALGTALGQLFGGSQHIVGGGHYDFRYFPVAGARYTQVG